MWSDKTVYNDKEETSMDKYKDKYKVVRQKGKNGKNTSNKDDTYIPAKNGVEIYRYNADTLALSFNTILYAKNRIKEIEDQGVKLELFQSGDNESAYLFPACDLDKVAEVVKAKKRRVFSEEEKAKLRERLEKSPEKRRKRH